MRGSAIAWTSRIPIWRARRAKVTVCNASL
jgi:hypothetical protein